MTGVILLGLGVILVILVLLSFVFGSMMISNELSEGMTAEQHERSAEVWGEYHASHAIAPDDKKEWYKLG